MYSHKLIFHNVEYYSQCNSNNYGYYSLRLILIAIFGNGGWKIVDIDYDVQSI